MIAPWVFLALCGVGLVGGVVLLFYKPVDGAPLVAFSVPIGCMAADMLWPELPLAAIAFGWLFFAYVAALAVGGGGCDGQGGL